MSKIATILGLFLATSTVFAANTEKGCTAEKLQREAEAFLAVKQNSDARFVQDCLEVAITTDIAQRNVKRDYNQEELSVINILESITADALFDSEALRKLEGIETDRANGSRDF